MTPKRRRKLEKPPLVSLNIDIIRQVGEMSGVSRRPTRARILWSARERYYLVPAAARRTGRHAVLQVVWGVRRRGASTRESLIIINGADQRN